MNKTVNYITQVEVFDNAQQEREFLALLSKQFPNDYVGRIRKDADGGDYVGYFATDSVSQNGRTRWMTLKIKPERTPVELQSFDLIELNDQARNLFEEGRSVRS